ncbi:hypothetical protein V2G26_014787 [Clonostachys chloroleuca]
MITLLLRQHLHGDINHQNEEGTPLLLTSRNGHTHTVRFLLLKGASVVDAGARDGSTPIHAAATFGHTDTLRVLLDSGADIGDVYHSKYQVVGKLGFGSTSTVWLAKNSKNMFMLP